MAAEMVRAAAADAGARSDVLAVEGLQVVYCMSVAVRRPGRASGGGARHLAPTALLLGHQRYRRLRCSCRQRLAEVAAGELDVALVVGAEALATKRLLKKTGERPAWSYRDPERKPFPFEAMPHEAEIAHDVFQAWLTFPLFDIARRAHSGRRADHIYRRDRIDDGADDGRCGEEPACVVPGRAVGV